MKIKLVSDLHLEFSDITINNDQNCDVLILSGDIMLARTLHDHKLDETDLEFSKVGKAKRFRSFLQRCSDAFPNVIYIAGNHEFYGGKWVGSLDGLREECARYPNIYFMENDHKVINNVTFVGGTLWTNMNKEDPYTLAVISGYLNDYHAIRNDATDYRKLQPIETVIRHKKTLAYIQEVVESDPTKTYIIVGHHSPSYLSVHEQYRDDFAMNGAYFSELSEFILDHPQIKLWTHGHTHHPFDYVIGETRVVCNPRGYHPQEETGWDINKVIEIG
jgi:predicted phosphodiesterase